MRARTHIQRHTLLRMRQKKDSANNSCVLDHHIDCDCISLQQICDRTEFIVVVDIVAHSFIFLCQCISLPNVYSRFFSPLGFCVIFSLILLSVGRQKHNFRIIAMQIDMITDRLCHHQCHWFGFVFYPYTFYSHLHETDSLIDQL